MVIPLVPQADRGPSQRRCRCSPGKCIGRPGTATRERFSQVRQLLKEMRRPPVATYSPWVLLQRL
ncbi:MAG: hypothetical protein ACKN9U_18775 [Pirellulaceae bacterium]